MPHQLVTYMFMHAGWGHIFFNMFSLWMFGRILEQTLGSRRFLLFYLVTGVGAALIQMGVSAIELSALAHKVQAGAETMGEYMSRINAPTLGASGAVFGILLAFGMLYPNARLMLLIPPIPMKAKYFVIIFGALELLFGVSGWVSGVAHFAHLGGMLWAYLLLWWWRKEGKIQY
jgi:membrane associated rhomboid family serine protease